MKIKTDNDLFELVCGKIIKFRKKAISRMKHAFPWSKKDDLKPFEVEKTKVTMDSILPRKVFNSLVSRRDVRRLNDKKIDEFDFDEGKTTVANFVRFFFRKKKRKK